MNLNQNNNGNFFRNPVTLILCLGFGVAGGVLATRPESNPDRLAGIADFGRNLLNSFKSGAPAGVSAMDAVPSGIGSGVSSGPSSSGDLASRTRAAESLTKQRKFREAETELRSIVSRGEQTLDNDDPGLARARCALAEAHSGSGKHTEAEAEWRKVHAACVSAVGAGHEVSLLVQERILEAITNQADFESNDFDTEKRSLCRTAEMFWGKESPQAGRAFHFEQRMEGKMEELHDIWKARRAGSVPKAPDQSERSAVERSMPEREARITALWELGQYHKASDEWERLHGDIMSVSILDGDRNLLIRSDQFAEPLSERDGLKKRNTKEAVEEVLRRSRSGAAAQAPQGDRFDSMAPRRPVAGRTNSVPEPDTN